QGEQPAEDPDGDDRAHPVRSQVLADDLGDGKDPRPDHRADDDRDALQRPQHAREFDRRARGRRRRCGDAHWPGAPCLPSLPAAPAGVTVGPFILPTRAFAAVSVGPRTGRPGRTASTNVPWSTTSVPFTST